MSIFDHVKKFIPAGLAAATLAGCLPKAKEEVSEGSSPASETVNIPRLKTILSKTDAIEFAKVGELSPLFKSLLKERRLSSDSSATLCPSDFAFLSYVNLAVGERRADSITTTTLEALQNLRGGEPLPPMLLAGVSHAAGMKSFKQLSNFKSDFFGAIGPVSEGIFDASPVFRSIRAGQSLPVETLLEQAAKFRHQAYAVKILEAALPSATQAIALELQEMNVPFTPQIPTGDKSLPALMQSFCATFNELSQACGSDVTLNPAEIGPRHIAAIERSCPALTLEYPNEPSAMALLATATAAFRCGLSTALSPHVINLMTLVAKEKGTLSEGQDRQWSTPEGVIEFFDQNFGIRRVK